MADDFRDAISASLHVAKYGKRVQFVDPELETYADAVLAMPEMEAIKEALFDATHPAKWKTIDGPRPMHVENLRAYDLSDSVIEWVLP